jgi:hypothetical protein
MSLVHLGSRVAVSALIAVGAFIPTIARGPLLHSFHPGERARCQSVARAAPPGP